jgi:cytochrome c oxidase cbb3-type subunit 3
VKRFPLTILQLPSSLCAVLLPCCLLAMTTPALPPGGQDPSRARPSTAARDSAEGRKAFESVCAGCHGLDGRGGERGPDIAVRPYVLRLTTEDTLRIMRDGRPSNGMPAFASLGDAKLADILQYLQSLQGRDKSRSSPEDPKNGRQLFFGKAQCSQCHTVNGQGGFLAADLSSYAISRDENEIREAILNPYKNLSPQARIVNVTTHDGIRFTGVARNEDNFSLQLLASDGTFHFFARQDLARIDYENRSYMPSDYAAKLTKQDLDNLISYLLDVATETKSQKIKTSPAGKED